MHGNCKQGGVHWLDPAIIDVQGRELPGLVHYSILRGYVKKNPYLVHLFLVLMSSKLTSTSLTLAKRFQQDALQLTLKSV